MALDRTEQSRKIYAAGGVSVFSEPPSHGLDPPDGGIGDDDRADPARFHI